MTIAGIGFRITDSRRSDATRVLRAETIHTDNSQVSLYVLRVLSGEELLKVQKTKCRTEGTAVGDLD
jgi:hypothetical protein